MKNKTQTAGVGDYYSAHTLMRGGTDILVFNHCWVGGGGVVMGVRALTTVRMECLATVN